jgi:hypothetical protein
MSIAEAGLCFVEFIGVSVGKATVIQT